MEEAWRLAPSDQWQIIRRITQEQTDLGDLLRRKDTIAIYVDYSELRPFLAFSVYLSDEDLLALDNPYALEILQDRYHTPELRKSLF